MVQAATLAVAVVALIWFSTVGTDRLRDERGRPHPMVFGLGVVAGALALTAAVFLATPTAFLIGAVVLAAAVVGIVRAIRASIEEA